MPRKKKKSDKCLPLTDLPNNVPHFLGKELASVTTPPLQETSAQTLIRFDRIITYSQMIRDRWDSKFRFGCRPKPNEDKKGYELKGKIFSRTLDLIQEIHLLTGINNQTSQITVLKWFILVVDELQIDALSFPSDSTPEPDSKTQVRKILQAQNSQIKAYKNPFSAQNSPATYHLIESARVLAESLDKFRQHYYTPFRQAREALTTHLIKEASLYKNNGEKFQPNRQGKKINPYSVRVSGEKNLADFFKAKRDYIKV